MSDALEAAAIALATCDALEYEDAARAVILAFLDPHSTKLQDVLLSAMGFYSEGGDFGPMARVQAHDAIAALKAHAKASADAGSPPPSATKSDFALTFAHPSTRRSPNRAFCLEGALAQAHNRLRRG